MKEKRNIIDKLTDDYQLIIRNYENLKELASIKFNYMRLIITTFLIITLLLGTSIFLVRNILKKWLNPAYIEQENKKKLITLSKTIKILEKQVNDQNKFISLIQKNIKSDVPFTKLDQQANLNIKKHSLKGLKKEYTLSQTSFFIPLNGIVTSEYNLEKNHLGIDIVAKENEPIKCIDNGIVISSSWESDNGWVISIQHKDNLVSVYKHNSALLRKSGDYVRKGDAVAIIGNSGDLTTGPHLHFEMWHNCEAIDPKKHINF